MLRQIPDLEVHVSIPTMDAHRARLLEPGTPPPAARMEAVRRLNQAGIRTGVFMAPILPGLTDSEATLRAVAEAAAGAGAPYVVPVTLRLAPEVLAARLIHDLGLETSLTKQALPQTQAPQQLRLSI